MSGLDKGFDFRWRARPAPQATVRKAFEAQCGRAPEAFAGKTVLDAGCGCGRYTKLLTDAGAIVTGIDASPAALDATAKNCPGVALRVVDLLTDFAADLGQFDAVLSLGVLHHTANPRAAFLNCAKAVQRGGELAVWLYSQNAADIALPMQFLHAITKACPPEALHAACEKYAVALRDHYAGEGGQLQQVLRASGSADDEECISDTFDWHCPQYRSDHSPAAVASWFAEAGFGVMWSGEAHPVGMRGSR